MVNIEVLECLSQGLSKIELATVVHCYYELIKIDLPRVVYIEAARQCLHFFLRMSPIQLLESYKQLFTRYHPVAISIHAAKHLSQVLSLLLGSAPQGKKAFNHSHKIVLPLSRPNGTSYILS